MPAQPAWFHRLDEIFTLLQGIEATVTSTARAIRWRRTMWGSGRWRIFPKPSRLGRDSCGSYLTGHWTWRPGYWSCPRQ